MSLDPSIKRSWIRKLRYGKIKKMNGSCIRGYTDSETGRIEVSECCALGVLGMVLAHRKIVKLHHAGGSSIEMVDTRPSGVAGADGGGIFYKSSTGLPSKAGQTIGLGPSDECKIVNLNDSQDKTFREIADYIEKNL